MRLADADVLPFQFKDLYKEVNGFVNELIALQEQTRENTDVENQLITSGDYKLAADPLKTFIVPAVKGDVPYLDFSPLQNALAALQKSTDSVSAIAAKAVNSPADHDALNKKLYQAEQQLLLVNGLPRRGWYKHSLYAPGFYTGYGVKTMPGIREAIEQRNWKEAQEQIVIDAEALNKLAAYLGGIN